MATIVLGLAVVLAVVVFALLAAGVARRSNGGFLGFVAVVSAGIGGVVVVLLSVISLFVSEERARAWTALGLGVATPVLAALLVLLLLPKSAFRL